MILVSKLSLARPDVARIWQSLGPTKESSAGRFQPVAMDILEVGKQEI